MLIDETIQQLDDIFSRQQQIKRAESNYSTYLEQLDKKIEQLNKSIKVITETREYWRKAIDIIYAKSIGELTERINVALKYICYDQDLEVELQLEDKRGKSLDIILKKDGEETSLKDGAGAGIRAIISAILWTYVILSKNSNIILADEKFSQISHEYIQNFYDFMTQLCESTGMSLVLITHDPRLLDFAQHKLQVKNGNITEVV